MTNVEDQNRDCSLMSVRFAFISVRKLPSQPPSCGPWRAQEVHQAIEQSNQSFAQRLDALQEKLDRVFTLPLPDSSVFHCCEEAKVTLKGLQAPVENSDPATGRHRRANAGRRGHLVDVHTLPLTILDPLPVRCGCFYSNLHFISLRSLQHKIRKTAGIDWLTTSKRMSQNM